jgi:hypothetical protein
VEKKGRQKDREIHRKKERKTFNTIPFICVCVEKKERQTNRQKERKKDRKKNI